MAKGSRPFAFAVALSLLAALGWASYYLFVLGVGGRAAPSAVLVYPFAAGGLAYAGWAASRGEGTALLRQFRAPEALLRTGLLVGMQCSVLACTYLTGPIDASLLSLLGDVVATPLLVAWWLVDKRPQVASAAFAVGLTLSLAGGALAIAGGRSLEAIPPAGWIAVPAVPVSVAFYFVLSANAGRRFGTSAVVAQSMVAAAVALAVLAPLVPGGWAGLLRADPVAVGLLVANGLVSFFLAPVLYFRAIATVGLVLPPILMTGIPVFTLLLSAVFLGIIAPPVALLGVPVAVVGGVVALRSERGERPAETAPAT